MFSVLNTNNEGTPVNLPFSSENVIFVTAKDEKCFSSPPLIPFQVETR